MRFSVIIPFYKYTSFLEDCLKSCFNQTFTNFDIFLINDGSPHSIDLKIKRVLNFNFNKISFHYYKLENGGAAAARNYASNLSLSDYLVFLDSDDLLHKDALKIYDIVLKDKFRTVLATKRFEFRDALDQFYLKTDLDISSLNVNFSENYFTNNIYFKFGASNIVIPRDSFLGVDGFRLRQEKTWYAEDHDLLLKLGHLNFVFIEEPFLVYYRYHQNNSINNLKGIGYGVVELIRANSNNKYPGGEMYSTKRMEIIGSPVFHIVKRLLTTMKIRLATIIFILGYKYIYFFLKSKIGKNAKRKSV